MPNLNEALFKIGALEEILEREFLLLKEKDFEQFDALQQRKNELLGFLANSEDPETIDVDAETILQRAGAHTRRQSGTRHNRRQTAP